MGISSAKLDDLLNAIEENCDPTAYRDLVIPFMIDCASLIELRMPAVALASFGVAKNHAAGRLSMGSVTEAIQRCWGELQKDRRETNLNDPEVSATRAVICVLQRQLEQESDDFLNLTSFFLQLLNNVEPHPEEQEALLGKHFPSCIGADD